MQKKKKKSEKHANSLSITLSLIHQLSLKHKIPLQHSPQNIKKKNERFGKKTLEEKRLGLK